MAGVSQEVAQAIYSQMGGGEFRRMTGAQVMHSSGVLLITLKRGMAKNRANHCSIELAPSDTYTMTFSSRGRRKGQFYDREISRHEDLYCDQIREVFERETGLATRFPRIIQEVRT